MYQHIRNGLLLLCVLSLCAACGKEGGDSGGTEGAEAGPTKAALIDVVKKLHGALSSGDSEGAMTHLLLDDGDRKQITNIVNKGWKQDDQDLSAAGIALLEEKGEFGPIAKLFTRKMKGGEMLEAERQAKSAGVPVGECYGLKLKSAEIMAHWKDGKFRIFRFDDAGSKVVRQMKE